MSVHLTRIYTRTGDDGSTTLGDMTRTRKTDPRVGAYADVDETNAALGVALTLGGLDEPIAAVVRRIQNELFDLGADLCTPVSPDPEFPPLRITQEYVDRLERWCDEFNEPLAKLDSFILPGERRALPLLHVARTVSRRAERTAWVVAEAAPDRVNPLAVTYLNRLSDLLFILARRANPGGDVAWVPGAERD